MAAHPQWRKEWIPLCSQQLRLRNLTQVLAYNVRGHGSRNTRQLFYYTLHLTSKSAPFYSSEPCTGPNPRWVEINLPPQVTTLSGTGLVVRIWQCGSPDELVTTWGLHLSGLVPVDLQEDLSSDLGPNALVFFLHGLPFVAPTNSQPVKRLGKTEVSANNARSSYTVNQLLRLHHIQLATANKAAVSDSLKQSIQRQGPFPPAATASGPSKRYRIQQLKAQREDALHRLWLLRGERARYEETITGLKAMAERLKEESSQRSTELVKKFEDLSKEEKRLQEFKLEMSHRRELLLHTTNQLANRRRQLISQLKLIYPIVEDAQGNVKICDVPLTNSDCVDSQDEASSAVALGFAAHATMMVATFLDVPLRYPIIPAGSRARIWDLVAPKLTPSEREFPLFSRGRDKMQFNYAVYVFNKDIAQLRWYCGLYTRDLRPTLLNLKDLFNIKVVPISSKHKRSLSASSQEYLASSHLSVLSSYDLETSIENRTAKPCQNTDLIVSPSISPQPPKALGSLESWDYQEPPMNDKLVEKEQALSCSLDHGLDTLQKPKFKQTLSLLSPGKTTNNSEPSLSSRVEDPTEEALEDTKVERQSLESMPTSNGSVHDNSYPVKARTYSEPCSSDHVPVIEEFHDCLSMPNIESASSPPERKDDKCEESNSAVEESSESDPVLTKLNSMDNLFASVASRTEALANRSGSFNLVKSRASTMESS